MKYFILLALVVCAVAQPTNPPLPPLTEVPPPPPTTDVPPPPPTTENPPPPPTTDVPPPPPTTENPPPPPTTENPPPSSSTERPPPPPPPTQPPSQISLVIVIGQHCPELKRIIDMAARLGLGLDKKIEDALKTIPDIANLRNLWEKTIQKLKDSRIDIQKLAQKVKAELDKIPGFVRLMKVDALHIKHDIDNQAIAAGNFLMELIRPDPQKLEKIKDAAKKMGIDFDALHKKVDETLKTIPDFAKASRMLQDMLAQMKDQRIDIENMKQKAIEALKKIPAFDQAMKFFQGMWPVQSWGH